MEILWCSSLFCSKLECHLSKQLTFSLTSTRVTLPSLHQFTHLHTPWNQESFMLHMQFRLITLNLLSFSVFWMNQWFQSNHFQSFNQSTFYVLISSLNQFIFKSLVKKKGRTTQGGTRWGMNTRMKLKYHPWGVNNAMSKKKIKNKSNKNKQKKYGGLSFHFVSFHCVAFHFVSFHSFHFISLLFISFHSFHFISFHFICLTCF